jgi:hypothetical protein
MNKNFRDFGMAALTAESIAQIYQRRHLKNVATEYDCQGAGSVGVRIAHRRISDNAMKNVIVTKEQNVCVHLDYLPMDTDDLLAVKTILFYGICQCMDQTILDALSEAKNIPLIQDFSEDPLTLFAATKAMLDERQGYSPDENRCLILPAAALPKLLTDGRMMSCGHVRRQLNNIYAGEISNPMGFQLIFLNDIKGGGLEYQITDEGSSRIWTCYATAQAGIGYAVDYGGNRVKGGSEEIFKIQEIANRGGYSATVSFCDGAKILIPEKIIRFTLKTKNYGNEKQLEAHRHAGCPTQD